MTIAEAAYACATGDDPAAQQCGQAVLDLLGICDTADMGFGVSAITMAQLRRHLNRGVDSSTTSVDVRYQAILDLLATLNLKADDLSTRFDTLSAKDDSMAASISDLNTLVANDDALEASLEAALAANTTELQALHDAVDPNLQPAVDKISARQAKVQAAITALQAADASNAPTPTVIPPATSASGADAGTVLSTPTPPLPSTPPVSAAPPASPTPVSAAPPASTPPPPSSPTMPVSTPPIPGAAASGTTVAPAVDASGAPAAAPPIAAATTPPPTS